MMRSTVGVLRRQKIQARKLTSSKGDVALDPDRHSIGPHNGSPHTTQKTGWKHKLPGWDLPLKFMGRTTNRPKDETNQALTKSQLDWRPQLFPTALDLHQGWHE